MYGRALQVEELLLHRRWLYRLAVDIVRDADLAQDLVPETWLAALRSAPPPEVKVQALAATAPRRDEPGGHLVQVTDLAHVPIAGATAAIDSLAVGATASDGWLAVWPAAAGKRSRPDSPLRVPLSVGRRVRSVAPARTSSTSTACERRSRCCV